MDLIIGTRHIIPDAITRTATGIEAVLHGDALLSLLNAAFHGSCRIREFRSNPEMREIGWRARC